MPAKELLLSRYSRRLSQVPTFPWDRRLEEAGVNETNYTRPLQMFRLFDQRIQKLPREEKSRRNTDGLPPENAGWFARNFGADETEASEAMKGHLFWTVFLGLLAVLAHILVLRLVAKLEVFPGGTPSFMQFPHLEINAFMVMSMGMLNIGLAVLVERDALLGWKAVREKYDDWCKVGRGSKKRER